MKAEIVGIGTELLMGELTDTNSSWIAGRLPALGIELQWVSIIGDDLPKLTEAFKRGMERSDIIFTTGGLGPTQDDLTREAIAAAFSEIPTVQQEVVEDLERYFAARGGPMPQHNIKQANLIPSARFIPNRNGTAPGWWAERDGKVIICMPGPPNENHSMWEEQVEPQLAELIEDEVTITRNIKTMGMSEGAVDEVISEFFGVENPYLGIYSKADGIHLRVIARARDSETAQGLILPVEQAIHDRLGEYIWGYDDDTPSQSAGRSLIEKGLSVAVIEMCTGGALTNSITDVPESVSYFKGGTVAYDEASLQTYGVPADVMKQNGVVSQQSANAMADTVRRNLNADLGVAVTGVPGPGEFEGKPL
ncbi:MAG: CinA family nicotinamide mononucleotide deamidase-related protein, partial [Chloroflexota bacterium]|nr:CinA family nicotinamide mononucleotide deamidase-related protein [Chloroflexota bacterium]